MTWVGVQLALALLAFHPLFLPVVGSARHLPKEVEEWLFVPSDTSPVVVLLLCAWMLYRRRSALAALPAHPAPTALLASLYLLAAAIVAWAAYTGARDLLAPAASLALLATGAAWRGTGAMRVLALPSLLLLFAMRMPAPLLSEVVWTFQLRSAQFAGWLLFLLGVPALVSGDLIYRASQTFQVIETCSGLRSVETLTLLSMLMVDLFRRGPLQSALVILAAPVCAFAMNGVRVVTLTLNPESEILAVHNLQGVVVLLGGLMLLYGLDGLLARVLPARPQPATPPSGALEPSVTARAATTVALVGLALLTWLVPRYVIPAGVPFNLAETVPNEIGRFEGEPLPLDTWFLGSVGFQQSLSRQYRETGPTGRKGPAIDLFVAVGNHDQRLRSPFSPKLALPGSGWVVEDRGVTTLESGREVHWTVDRKRTHRQLVFSWVEGTRGLADEVLRSLLGLDQSPFRRPRPGLVFRIGTDLEDGGQRARLRAEKRLHRFSMQVRESIGDPWGEAGGSVAVISQYGKDFSFPDGRHGLRLPAGSASYGRVRERHMPCTTAGTLTGLRS